MKSGDGIELFGDEISPAELLAVIVGLALTAVLVLAVVL